MLNWSFLSLLIGKGGKNRRRGKNENENDKRELVFKEDGQGKWRSWSVLIGARGI